MAHELDGVITDPKHPRLQYPRIISSPFGAYIAPWWLERELIRIDEGVYPTPTDVLTKLSCNLGQYAVHISKEDPKMIAYTPDAASGVRDKQVRTTLARFLTKFYPQMDDVSIAKVQADHLAELDVNIEILTGEQIVDVYLEGRNSSCMTDNAYKRFNKSNHPSWAYDAPNISMAVLRNAEGLITSRCMLYTPTEDDRRYIRCYGDVVLLQKLKRAGYKAGSWVGAKFKTVPVPHSPNHYIMPYLDTNGGRGNDMSCNVVVIDGQLQCVSSNVASKLTDLFGSGCVRPALLTAGQIVLKPISSTGFTRICPVTGLTLDSLVDTDYKLWNGKDVLNVSEFALHGMQEVGLYWNTKVLRVWTSPNIKTFVYRGGTYIDTTDTRKHLGYVQLSEKYYPEDRGWYLKHAYVKTRDDHYIKHTDCVLAASQMGFHQVHNSEVTKGWVKLHARTTGELCYAPPGVEVVKTSTGRKIVEGCYEVQKTYTGAWEFSRNVQQFNFMGHNYWKTKKDPCISLEMPEGQKILHDWLFSGNYSSLDKAVSALVRRHINAYLKSDKPGKAYGQQYVGADWPSPWRYCLEHADVRDNAVAQAAKKMIEMFFAEAEALDYSLLPQTVEQPEPVLASVTIRQASAEALPEDYQLA